MVTPTPQLLVREASSTDAPVIADLHRRSLLATYPEVLGTSSDRPRTPADGDDPAAIWAERIQAAEGTVLVAEQAARVVGVVWCGPSPDPDDGPPRTLRLHSLHADPDHLGSGIGRELLAAACRWMRAAGATDASLWVVDSNQRAQRFYRRDGWSPDGARRQEALSASGADGPQVDVLRLRRQL